MAVNAAGLEVAGNKNPNWKGGPLEKVCEVCGVRYIARRAQHKSRFCSLKCVGLSQKGRPAPWNEREKVTRDCPVCGKPFTVLVSLATLGGECCSRKCAGVVRSRKQSGQGNPNWLGGTSRLPYPWNFYRISKLIRERDGDYCQNPACGGDNARRAAHHINYDKQDCRDENLITLCFACNAHANFNRSRWEALYFLLVRAKPKKLGGGWEVEAV